MYGSMAPGQTWQMTFLHAPLGPPTNFVPVSLSSELCSMGNGIISSHPPKPSPRPSRATAVGVAATAEATAEAAGGGGGNGRRRAADGMTHAEGVEAARSGWPG